MSLLAEHITKSYGMEPVLHGIDLEVPKGKTMAILGRSGCGKTTLLKILAGLEGLDNGTVFLDKKNVTDLPPHTRKMVYAFQEAMLFPHMNVRDNIAFGLKIQKVPKDKIDNRVGEMLEEIGLKGFDKKMPHELSGGQAQRVAFGRALITEPRVLLLDEPFGKLDVETRSQMQTFFQAVTRSRQIHTLFVTHDLKEALRVGDLLAYMDRGRLITFADKQAFLNDPRTGAKAEKAFWDEVMTNDE